MMKKPLFIKLFSLVFLSCLNFCPLSAQYEEGYDYVDICPVSEPPRLPRGKVDIGAAYVHVDVLFKGHTAHKIDLAAVKGDLHYRVWSGLILKPTFLFGGGHNDNELATGGIGVGFYVPVCNNFSITPLLGYNWGYLRATFTHDHDLVKAMEIGHLRIRERFRSEGPYVGFETSWTFRPCWRAVLSYQYAWSRTHTHIRLAGIDPAKLPIPGNALKEDQTNSHGHSEGSTISGMIEHDFTDCFSVNIGAAYNNSLSKEKHGLRGWGVKIGVAYWF